MRAPLPLQTTLLMHYCTLKLKNPSIRTLKLNGPLIFKGRPGDYKGPLVTICRSKDSSVSKAQNRHILCKNLFIVKSFVKLFRQILCKMFTKILYICP